MRHTDLLRPQPQHPGQMHPAQCNRDEDSARARLGTSAAWRYDGATPQAVHLPSELDPQPGRRKFAHVRVVGEALPRLRRRVGTDLNSRGLTRGRVLALAARLLDLGLFRVGGDAYAAGADPTFGVAMLRARHVSRHGSELDFDYPPKGNAQRTVTVTDPAAAKATAGRKWQRTGTDRLLAWRDKEATWHEIHSDDINDYLRSASGIEMSAKDLRTWHATVRAAARCHRRGRRPPGPQRAAQPPA